MPRTRVDVSFLSAEERELLLSNAFEQTFAPGEIVFRKGDPGERMYFIASGLVEIIFEDGYPGKALDAGKYFGEIALLAGGIPRTATVVALEPTRLLVIDQTIKAQLQDKHPQIICALLQKTCSYLVRHEHELLVSLTARTSQLEQTLDYLRRTREELTASEVRSNTDELTGLYNRRCFNQQIARFLDQAREKPRRMALVLIDLDRFKAINDTYGHSAGDTVLKRLGQTIRDHAEFCDLPFRLGGDEFALAIMETSEHECIRRAQLLHHSITALDIRIPETMLNITVSMGGAQFQPGDSGEILFRRADENLYLAKENGRNRLGWGNRIATPA